MKRDHLRPHLRTLFLTISRCCAAIAALTFALLLTSCCPPSKVCPEPPPPVRVEVPVVAQCPAPPPLPPPVLPAIGPTDADVATGVGVYLETLGGYSAQQKEVINGYRQPAGTERPAPATTP